MSIVALIAVLVVIGVGLYLLELVPMDATIKRIIQVVAILLVVLWILDALFGGFGSIRLR